MPICGSRSTYSQEFGVWLILRWLRGHLDTKETDNSFSDHDFVLNCHADKFAEATTADYQVSAPDAANYFHSAGRVGKVQARLAAILCSPVLTKTQMHQEPNLAQPKANQPSAHVICEQRSQLECIVRLSTCSKHLGSRQWLDSCCMPATSDDNIAPVPVCLWESVRIGTQIGHNTHSMYTYKGVK